MPKTTAAITITRKRRKVVLFCDSMIFLFTKWENRIRKSPAALENTTMISKSKSKMDG